MSPVYQPPAASGGGSVATDVIWDTKGDLAAATGADAAVKVAAGANGTALIADSSQSAGVGWSVPTGTIVDYVEFTADISVTATTEGTAQACVTGAGFTANGTDAYWVEFYAPNVQTGVAAGAMVVLTLYDNGSVVAGGAGFGRCADPSASTFYCAPCLVRRKITPSAASHTFSIRAWRVTSNGLVRGQDQAAASLPGYMSVTKA